MEQMKLLFMLLFAILFAWIGHTMAKKKNRNEGVWGTLSFFFGFWPLIILAFLPKIEQKENLK